MIKSLYELIAAQDNLTLSYLHEIKETTLFKPIIEIKNVDANPGLNIHHYEYSYNDKIKLIKFVVYCFSKESPFLKSDITIHSIINNVCDYLEITGELKNRIIEYRITELDQVVINFIKRDCDEYLRELLIASIIYDKQLNLSLQSSEGKEPKDYYDRAQDFKEKIYQLKSAMNRNSFTQKSMINHALDNIQSIRSADLIDAFK